MRRLRRLLPALLALLSAFTLAGCQEGQTLPPVIEESLPKVEDVLPKVEEYLQNAEELLPDLEAPLPGTEAGGSTETGSETSPVQDTDIAPVTDEFTETVTAGAVPAEDGVYDSRDDVALYLVMYQHLPDNYITKAEARALGWSGGGLEKYAPGKCIGGDRFGNREGNLPQGHTYTECDIDTLGASSRGAKRIVFDESFFVYYTGDHYETFELLYGGTTP